MGFKKMMGRLRRLGFKAIVERKVKDMGPQKLTPQKKKKKKTLLPLSWATKTRQSERGAGSCGGWKKKKLRFFVVSCDDTRAHGTPTKKTQRQRDHYVVNVDPGRKLKLASHFKGSTCGGTPMLCSKRKGGGGTGSADTRLKAEPLREPGGEPSQEEGTSGSI